MRLPHLTAIVLMLTPISASAGAEDCENARDQATLNQCAGEAYKAADAKLNAAYKDIESRLDTDTRKLLTQAQRAWISYRDAECRFQTSSTEGGSVYPMVLSECMHVLTSSRLEDFQNYLTCDEGDLSCPVPAGR